MYLRACIMCNDSLFDTSNFYAYRYKGVGELEPVTDLRQIRATGTRLICEGCYACIAGESLRKKAREAWCILGASPVTHSTHREAMELLKDA